ncbi:MAG: phosphohistidine phosphatase SixA, partial [Alteromonadales bacterium]|nr:phosphohistidine phosphatase SixA [Alteromonadales bacterium]
AMGIKNLLIVSHLPLVGYIVGELAPSAGVPAFATSSVGHVELDDNGFGYLHSLTRVSQL